MLHLSLKHHTRTCLTLLLVAVLSALIACERKVPPRRAYTDAQWLQLDTTDNHTKNIDSLTRCVLHAQKQDDRPAEMAALAALGHGYQTDSRYADAVKAHQEQLALAELLNDTLMRASALNDLGVNYRRLGLYYDALDYHLRAIEVSLLCPEESVCEKILKCRAIGYNGVGNVYLSIGNYQKADAMLRKALAVEQRLGSHLGMNVDLANLGLVYEKRGLIDSAWIYYKQAMHHSRLAQSSTGQAYGHMNYGRLHALSGDYVQAMQAYHRSMALVRTDRDLWLWMQPALALAEAYVEAGMTDSATLQLNKAESMAQRIAAKEYFSKIDHLRAKLYERRGDYHRALTLYRQAEAREDSLISARNLFEIETLQNDISIRHQERQEGERERKLSYALWVGRIMLVALLITLLVLGLLLYIQQMRRRNHLALKQMTDLRENFFTNITHEFRTPLTVILGLSHDLQADSSTVVKDKAQVIERQGQSLLMLINQLLDISKIKSAVGAPDWRSGDIVVHLNMIVDTYYDYAHGRNIDLHFQAKESVEMDFVPDYVNKLLNNLLSNAFKFTPAYGKVSVLVWREGRVLRINVADTGQGMDETTLAHIFTPFYQAESQAQTMGTGVGMALVKQIIDALQGSISVESAVGKGTTFHISLPIHHESQRPLLPTAAPLNPLLPEQEESLADGKESESGLRLLVIEDNRDIAAHIGSIFADSYTVAYASNGQEGLAKAEELVPDLIITDLMMPGMDGLTVCRCVRANEIINHIPIIVVTAKITEEERIRGIEAGADAYMAKPFNADELRRQVERLLEARRVMREKLAQKLVVLHKENAHQESCQLTEEKTNESDLTFLMRVADAVYVQLARNKDMDVAQLASCVCMSGRQLHRKLVALTGYTPVAYIQQLKIKKAKSLMDNAPHISLAEVADRCGFELYPNFTRAFKNVCGITPTEYRKQVEQRR